MIQVANLPAGRRAWLQSAHIPRARIGWELSDCIDLTKGDLNTVNLWMKKVSAGKVIRADGQKICGNGLLIVGKPGHGKTTLALSIIQDMMRNNSPESFSLTTGKVLARPCYFATFNDIIEIKGELIGSPNDELERLFLGMHGECDDDAYNIRVLVIDDVGKEHSSGSGWQRTMLHHILRTRFNNGLPTIVTTNLPVEAWDSAYGDATGSFLQEAFTTIELESIRGDLRG